MTNSTPSDRILCRGGKTGRKIHRASRKSSVLACGRWVKSEARYYRVADDTPEARERHSAHLCEQCFPTGQE